jgi:hypothetical protein
MMPTDVHADAAGARVMNAFGITSTELAECLMSQIINTTHLRSSNEPVAEANLNAALAAVTGIAPRDEAEAMLAVQMVGVHWLAMDLLRKANDRARLIDAGNLAVKLLRTYTAQLEALKRYRSAGEQRVVVQHVNVTADRAAVQVNPMPTPQGEGDGMKLEDQSHAQAVDHASAHAPVGPLRSTDPARDILPAAGCGRAEAMPDARRR